MGILPPRKETSETRLTRQQEQLASLRQHLRIAEKAHKDHLATVKRLTEVAIPALEQEIPALRARINTLAQTVEFAAPVVAIDTRVAKLEAQIARLRKLQRKMS